MDPQSTYKTSSPEIVPVTALAEALSATGAPLESFEPYCLSQGYYEFTGRRGLRIFRKEDAVSVTCVHPNKDGTMLVFPEFSSDPKLSLTWSVVSLMLKAGYKVQFARLNVSQLERLCTVHNSLGLSTLFSLSVFEEDLLDWRYPVYILDSDSVIKRQGAAFAQLRQRLGKLARTSFEVRALHPERDVMSLMHLIHNWAKENSKPGYNLSDLTDPARRVFSIMARAPERFLAQVISIENEIKSYCIVERPSLGSTVANQMVIAAANNIMGLSEWQMVVMCEAAAAEGIKEINIGGSEAHGLDRFKRKFAPVRTIDLHSVAVEPNPSSF